LAGAAPQAVQGELTALPRTPYLDLRGLTSKGRKEGQGESGKAEDRKRGRGEGV